MQDHSLLWFDFQGNFFETELPHQVYLNQLLLVAASILLMFIAVWNVEKEESILKKEVKICMPYYKIAYSIAFVVILSAIQPVVYANEIGQAVERAVSLLAVVFCADTYLVEVQSKRSEVFCLYNLKKQAGVVYKRLFVQVAYLIGISLLAYGLFYCRNR